MNSKELKKKFLENKIESLVVLAGILNGVYSMAVRNWLGAIVSLAVVMYILPEVLRDEE